jgi:hypothetical protein
MKYYQSIYIGGTGRCGTNILKKVLCNHPNVCGLPFEPRYLLDPDGIFDFYENTMWSPYVVDFKLRRLKKILNRLSKRDLLDHITIYLYNLLKINKLKLTPPRYQQWELDRYIPGFSNHVNELFDEMVEFSHNSYWYGSESFKKNNIALFSKKATDPHIKDSIIKFIDKNVDSILNHSNANIYVDDSTFNILHANDIQELCRNSSLIHIFRDPRDVISSYLQQNWAPNNLDSAIIWYKSILNEWLEQKKKLPDSFYMEIRFEDFILNFSTEIKKIEDFTGINFNQIQFKPSVNRANIRRWENDFSASNKKKVNEQLSEQLKILGYI